MKEIQSSKHYDLEERTLNFACRVIEFVNRLPKTLPNLEISKQLVKSSGSVGSNYIEANEALSKKDFVMRRKICRKEAKESSDWLKRAKVGDKKEEKEQQCLIQEAMELTKIFGSILEKSK